MREEDASWGMATTRKGTTRRKPAAKGKQRKITKAGSKKKPASGKPTKRSAAGAGKPRTGPSRLPDVERLIAELQRQHDGDPWHGPSRAAILADVSAAEAAWRPGGGAHSIWELVLHMRSWTREVERRALGGVPAMPEDGDWPPVLDTSESAWADVQASLEAAHEHIVSVVRSLGPARLAERVAAPPADPAGSGISHRAMLYSLAQHDVYHSGQIAILKRLARAALEATAP